MSGRAADQLTSMAGELESATAHGGDLRLASARYGIPASDWLDLSTGINPEPYPVGALEPKCFEQLPYPQPELLELAAAYYGSDQLLPVAGTQMAIQLLPQCLPPVPVLLPRWGYQEHRLQWQRAGVEIDTYPSLSDAAARGSDRDRRRGAGLHEVTSVERAHRVSFGPDPVDGVGK